MHNLFKPEIKDYEYLKSFKKDICLIAKKLLDNDVNIFLDEYNQSHISLYSDKEITNEAMQRYTKFFIEQMLVNVDVDSKVYKACANSIYYSRMPLQRYQDFAYSMLEKILKVIHDPNDSLKKISGFNIAQLEKSVYYIQNKKVVEYSEKINKQSFAYFNEAVSHRISNDINVAHNYIKLLENCDINNPAQFNTVVSKLSNTSKSSIQDVIHTLDMIRKNEIDCIIKQCSKKEILFVLDIFKNKYLDKLEILIDVAESIDSIAMDELHLIRTLMPLLDNAVEANAQKLFIEMSNSNNDVLLKVSNDGDIIEEEKRDKIYNRFYSSKNSDGLGLNYIQEQLNNKNDISLNLNNKKTQFVIVLKKATNK